MGLFGSIGSAVAGALGGPAAGILAGGGGGSAGNLVMDALTGGALSQKEANERNIQLAQENREWSERMSSTAYQRAMADMRKAGLNPLLAFSQGGASTPTASPAKVEKASIGQGLFNSAQAISSGVLTGRAMMADTQVKEAQVGQTESQSALNLANAQKSIANAKESAAQKELIDEQKINTREYRDVQRWKYFNERADVDLKMKESARRVIENQRLERMNNLERERYETDMRLQDMDAIIDRASAATGLLGTTAKAIGQGIRGAVGSRLSPSERESIYRDRKMQKAWKEAEVK